MRSESQEQNVLALTAAAEAGRHMVSGTESPTNQNIVNHLAAGQDPTMLLLNSKAKRLKPNKHIQVKLVQNTDSNYEHTTLMCIKLYFFVGKKSVWHQTTNRSAVTSLRWATHRHGSSSTWNKAFVSSAVWKRHKNKQKKCPGNVWTLAVSLGEVDCTRCQRDGFMHTSSSACPRLGSAAWIPSPQKKGAFFKIVVFRHSFIFFHSFVVRRTCCEIYLWCDVTYLFVSHRQTCRKGAEREKKTTTRAEEKEELRKTRWGLMAAFPKAF